jgi:threonine/homoserine/homoserine lactone efflux protein
MGGIRCGGAQNPAGIAAAAPRAMHRLFTDGVFVSILNPKIAVFFLAFLPQFVDPSRGSVPKQILLLGLMYIALALITDSCYALLADRARCWLGGGMAHGPLPQYVSGGVYLGVGISTALAGQRN